jgi:hypothetical protein
MLKFSQQTLAFCWIATLSACAVPAPDADYGAYPVNFEAGVRERIGSLLKDPDSARYQFGAPVKGYANTGLIYGGGVTFTGYFIPVEVNARNGFGGYTGFEDWFCLYSGNSVGNCIHGSYRNSPLAHTIE